MASSDNDIKKSGRSSDHLANERTFLAWIRTSIGIMAFGFVLVKFALFLRQFAFVLQKDQNLQPQGYSSVIGIAMVGFGALIGLLGFIKYLNVRKQIDSDRYQSSIGLSLILTIVVLVLGLLLVVYLIHNINR